MGLKMKKKVVIILTFVIICSIVMAILFTHFFKTSVSGITKAEMAKMVCAASCNDDEFILLGRSDIWYEGYVNFARDKFGLDMDFPQDNVTVKDVKKILENIGASKDSEYIKGKKDTKKITRKEFISIFLDVQKLFSHGDELSMVTTVVVATPSNMSNGVEWQAFTDEGEYRFTGLSIDSAIDKSVTFIAKGREIICVKEVNKEAKLNNAWVISESDGNLKVFVGGIEKEYKVKNLSEDVEGVMADIHLYDGKVKSIDKKTDTIDGKVLSATTSYIEIEGYGKVALDENYKIYRTYGGMSLQNYGDLIVGYDLQEFIVADGKICGAAITKPLNVDKVRVLIKTSDYANLFHNEITLSSDKGITIYYGDKNDKKNHINPGESITFGIDSSYLLEGRARLKADDGGEIWVNSISRAYGTPHYEGEFEVAKCDEGLVLINDIEIESYLKRVVPSEMPTSFGVEALKVQAVCARSYAYKELENNNYVSLGAHMDDSTLYQVYNNTKESDAANKAIAQTDGKVLTYEGELVQTYYYSTSCGMTTDVSLWGSDNMSYPYFQSKAVGKTQCSLDLTDEENFAAFIKNIKEDDFDRQFDLYRWQMNVSKEKLSESFNMKLGGRRMQFPNQIKALDADGEFVTKKIDTIGKIKSITVERRVNGGACVSVIVAGEEGTVKIDGENHIRYMFGVSDVPILTINGNTRNMSSLPSTFCIFEEKNDDFVIIGGGYGHGIGMSQNAVVSMVKSGMNYEEILTFFYPSTKVL